MLDKYEAILPEPERTRFREDLDRLIRRTLTHDRAHQAVHLAWLSARATRLRSKRAQRSSKRSAKSCATTLRKSVWMGLPTRWRTYDAG